MIAIWGANGFIGRHLTKAMGDADVKLFARDYEGFPFELPSAAVELERDFLKPETYVKDMRDCRVAVMLVSASASRTFAGNPDQEIQANVRPYEMFLQSLEGVEHIVYVSSGGTVYGVTEPKPISEDQTTKPVSPYGKAKLTIESLIKNSGRDYTILRAANPIGVWNKKPGLVNLAINALRSGKDLTVFGDGSSVRDYFDVAELAGAIKLTIEKPAAKNQILNVGSGKGASIKEILALVEKISGKQLSLDYTPAHNFEVPYNVLDCGKIKNLLGWQAKRKPEDIIEEIWRSSR